MSRRRSPISYFGGKGALIDDIFPLMDFSGITEYREPFIGGGSMFFYLREKYPNLTMWINDIHFPLINLYLFIRDNVKALSSALEEFLGLSEEKAFLAFHKLRYMLYLKETSDFEKAIAYAYVNCCAYGGKEHCGFVYPNYRNKFNTNKLESLDYFSCLLKGVKITCLDYTKLLSTDRNILYYFDPPYLQEDVKRGYYGKDGGEHLGFDHNTFLKKVSSLNRPYISYNNITELRYLYSSWKLNRILVYYPSTHEYDSELLICR